ncbi:MAG: hypothetical protein CVU98_00320 [Firmicutes bacterium HGW-Firmicutes-3]|jgi:hypothetical protein|nr:MAG: hypothetical protein CVU98_00320 [Firmicutes bacterium HGW-Firmicutes-3]
MKMKVFFIIIILTISTSFVSLRTIYNEVKQNKTEMEISKIESSQINTNNEVEHTNMVPSELFVEESKIKRSKLNYSYKDDLNVEADLSNFTLSLSFGQCGINDIFSIKKIELVGVENQIAIESCTDWVGPYTVKYIGTEKNTNKEIFTGGWHGSNGDVTGNATAFTKMIAIYADGKEIKKKTNGEADIISIVLKNEIKGFNINDYVIEETVTYTIYENQVDIKVQIVAIHDLEILRYYGLQTQNNMFDNEIKYLYEDGRSITKSLGMASDSGVKNSENKVISFELSGITHQFLLKAWINSDGLLSSFNYIAADKAEAFTTYYGKSYFNLINGNTLVLKAGENLVWSGGYSFKLAD